MADATTKLSGYLTPATEITWASGQAINSLTDNEYTDLSDEIDNSNNLYAWADFELVLASAAYTGADSQVELFIIPSVDGTNYPTWTGNGTTVEQENTPFMRDVFSLTGTTAAQRAICTFILLPQGKFKVALRSRANVTLGSSGNTLKYRPHSFVADEA